MQIERLNFERPLYDSDVEKIENSYVWSGSQSCFFFLDLIDLLKALGYKCVWCESLTINFDQCDDL